VKNTPISLFGSSSASLLLRGALTLSLAATVAAGASTVAAQDAQDTKSGSGSSQSSMSGSKASASDSKFASEAASGGMAEVKLGQLAQEKGSSEKIKEFGQKMVTDHTKANEELKQTAQQQGITLPQEMSSKDQATYDRLSKLQGKQFDEAYARSMQTDHQKDVAAFQKEASSGKNDGLKQFASQTLPTLKEHLRMAQELGKANTSASMQQ
jgi:putative membrane protein